MAQPVAAASVVIDANAVKFINELKRAEAKSRQFGKQSSRNFDDVSRAMRNITLTAAAVGASLAVVAKQLSDAGIKAQGLERAFRAATGSAEAGAREFRFVRQEAERLGLDLVTSAESYAKLSAAAKGTAIEGQAARDIFTAVSEASRVLSLSAEQTGGALTAIEQIISKGKVSAEELRGQLGERLPGAFQIAARSIGVTTAELDDLLKQGKLTAEQLLPNLAKELRKTFGSEVESAANDAQAAYNRFSTAVFDLQTAIANSGVLDALSSLANGATSAVRAITDLARQFGLIPDTPEALRAAQVKFWAEEVQKSTKKLAELKRELIEAGTFSGRLFGADASEIKAKIDAEREQLKIAQEAVERLSQPITIEVNRGASSSGSASAPGIDLAAERANIEAATAIRLEALRREKEAEAALTAQFNQRAIEQQLATDQELLAAAEQFAAAKVIAAFNAEQAAKGELGEPLTDEERLEQLKAFNDAKIEEYERLANEQARIAKDSARAQVDADNIAQDSKQSTVTNLVGLLSVFAGKSKAIGILLIGIETARALAENKIATALAVTKTLASLPYPANLAAAAQVQAIGLANSALIAATGVARGALSLGGGGGGFSSLGGGGISTSTPGSTFGSNPNERQGQTSTQVIFSGDFYGWDEYTQERVITSIRDAVKERDVILIDPNSRNGQDLLSVE